MDLLDSKLGMKKTVSRPVKGNSQEPWTKNLSAPARNLGRDKLGAIIFGCKNHTIAECLESKIFGLPGLHYSYVKNIPSGLTLFLFNYTTRQLHGIYEAASHGQMNINKYAWTSNEGTDITAYPAQVRINVRRQCQPLREEAFKPVIADNYYSEKLFWFELDKAQAAKLTSLFLLSPDPDKPRNAISGVPGSSLQGANVGMRQHHEKIVSNGHSRSSFPVERNIYPPDKKWNELFKSSPSLPAMEETKGSGLEGTLSSSSNQAGQYHPEACTESANSSITNSWEELVDMDSDLKKQCIPEKKWCELFKALTTMENAGGPDLWQRSFSSSDVVSQQLPGASTETTDASIVDNWEELADMDSDMGVYETVHEQENDKDSDLHDATSLDDRTLESLVAVEAAEAVLSSEEESVITKLIEEIERLNVNQFNQWLKIDFLEHELANTKMELYQMKKRCKHVASSVSFTDVSPSLTSGESVLVVGGYNGRSWVEDVNLYSPSEDKVKSLCSMTFPRSYAAVSNLNNELYLVGGVHDGVWYDTVESYNPLSNQWVQRPPLNKKKGSIAGASIHGKIYAIGGGNGVECFAEVELFDINVARWMPTRSMLEKRFAPAAVEMNGALYVAGGYDGRNYLSSAERFDPREHSWGVLFSMESRRGGHSMVVCEEKIYAMGGYDGARMVSSVEVFDPRLGLWATIEPMTASRGYFGAFLVNGRICVIGGLDENDAVLDVVEYYEEGSGWQRIAKSSALGKRCFFASLFF